MLHASRTLELEARWIEGPAIERQINARRARPRAALKWPGMAWDVVLAGRRQDTSNPGRDPLPKGLPMCRGIRLAPGIRGAMLEDLARHDA